MSLDTDSHDNHNHRMSHTQQSSTSYVGLSKVCHFACSLALDISWCSLDLSLSVSGVGERRSDIFPRHADSYDRRLKNLRFDMCSVCHSSIFTNSSYAHMISTLLKSQHTVLSATGDMSDSVTLTLEHSPLVGTTSWGWPIGHQEQAHRAERYVRASKSQLWGAPGSQTLLSLLLYASEGDDLPLQALGFRGVKDDRRVRHPWIPAPGCVEPLGALPATHTSLGGVINSRYSNHQGSHHSIDESGAFNNISLFDIMMITNLILTLLYLSISVKKSKYKSKSHTSSKGLLVFIIITMLITDSHCVNTRGGGGTSGDSGSTPRPSDLLPNLQKDWDFLPGVKRWNGHPYHDFL